MNLSVALTQGLIELALTRSRQEEPTPAEELAPLFLTIAILEGLTRQRTVSQIAGQALELGRHLHPLLSQMAPRPGDRLRQKQ